jgi:hypothetical protein
MRENQSCLFTGICQNLSSVCTVVIDLFSHVTLNKPITGYQASVLAYNDVYIVHLYP